MSAREVRVINTQRVPQCQLMALAPNSWDGQWMNRQQIQNPFLSPRIKKF